MSKSTPKKKNAHVSRTLEGGLRVIDANRLDGAPAEDVARVMFTREDEPIAVAALDDIADDLHILLSHDGTVDGTKFEDALWRIERRARAAAELARREYPKLARAYPKPAEVSS